MKNLRILIAGFLLLCINCYSQSKSNFEIPYETDKDTSIIKWKKISHNFKTVEHLKPVKAVFEFENTGDVPLIIISVVPQCGCTAANFPKEPILPEKSGSVTVTYNAANKGYFNKSATVTTNSKTPKYVLTIKGEVL